MLRALRAAGKIMSEKVDALRLTFYTAPSSCAVLAPFFYAREARGPTFSDLLNLRVAAD